MRVQPLAVALALLGASLLGGCAGSPSGGGGDLEAALAYLSKQPRSASGCDGGFAPYVAEAGWAADKDLSAWPPGDAVLPEVVLPPPSCTLLQQLRPLLALALAHAPGSDGRIARIVGEFDGEQFGQALLLNDDAFALVALHADGHGDLQPEVRAASSHLLAAGSDGGWSYAVGGHPGVDTTGFALLALAASGRIDEVDRGATVALLAATHDAASGGYAESAGGEANCDSTVWALRSLYLLGVETPDAAWDYLASLQQADGGVAYQDGQGSNALCTAEVATLWGLRATGRLAWPIHD